MPRVVVISNQFFPAGSVGVIRVAKFVRYLPEFGWEPIVVCSNRLDAEADPTVYAGMPPDLPLYRVGALSGTRLQRGREGERTCRPRGRLQTSLWRRFGMPDDKMPWIPAAVRAALAACRRHRPAAILATSPPPSNLVVAAIVSRRTGVPLVLDYRDPWCAGNRRERPRRLYKRWEPSLERFCVSQSAGVVAVNDGMTEAIAAAYPEWDGLLGTIPNGFDQRDVIEAKRRAPDRDPNALRIVHTGKLPFAESVENVDSLAGMIGEWSVTTGRPVELVLAGAAAGGDMGLAERMRWFGPWVRVLGTVPYAESLALQQSADVLLLCLDRRKFARYDPIPSKLFEYAASHKPVLALVPPGSQAERVVGRYRLGASADVQSPGAVTAALDRVAEWGPTVMPPALLQCERRRLTAALANVLDRVGEPRGIVCHAESLQARRAS